MHTAQRAGFMSPSQASYISKRNRKALGAGLLTPHQFAVLEVLLWEARPRGCDRVAAAYSWLEKLACVCRQTVVDAIKAGERLGLVRKVKRKVLALWSNGGRQWLQRPNEYVFCCESAGQAESPKKVIQILTVEANGAEIRAAQAAMAARVRVIQAGLLDKGRPRLPTGG